MPPIRFCPKPRWRRSVFTWQPSDIVVNIHNAVDDETNRGCTMIIHVIEYKRALWTECNTVMTIVCRCYTSVSEVTPENPSQECHYYIVLYIGTRDNVWTQRHTILITLSRQHILLSSLLSSSPFHLTVFPTVILLLSLRYHSVTLLLSFRHLYCDLTLITLPSYCQHCCHLPVSTNVIGLSS